MRSIRIFTSVLLLLIAMFSAGCTKTWSVVFDDIQDILDWDSFALGDEPSSNVTPDGLVINGMRIQAPYIFTGSCTMVVVFDMNCDMMNEINEFAILLTNYLSDGEVLAFRLENFGDTFNQSYTVVDNDEAVAYEYSTSVDIDTNWDGENEFVMKRDSGRLVLSINGEIFYDGVPVADYQDYAYPGFLVDISGGSARITIKSITMKYDGEKVPV